MQIQTLVDQLPPASNHREVLQARMFGIADALCYELADQLLKEMAGECSPDYVAHRLRDFFDSLLLPFTLTAVDERRAGLPPVTETPQ